MKDMQHWISHSAGNYRHSKQSHGFTFTQREFRGVRLKMLPVPVCEPEEEQIGDMFGWSAQTKLKQQDRSPAAPSQSTGILFSISVRVQPCRKKEEEFFRFILADEKRMQKPNSDRTDCSGCSWHRFEVKQAFVATLLLRLLGAQFLLHGFHLLVDWRFQRWVQFQDFSEVCPSLLLVPHCSVSLSPLVEGLHVIWEEGR